jgi:hypothetical protein
VRSQAGRALIQLHQNPHATAVEQLWALALPGLPAARPPLGTLESISRITRDQSHAFHRDRYRPDGAVLAIAGDVTPERAWAAAAEWLGGWQPGAAPPPATGGAARRAAGTPRIRVLDQPGPWVRGVGRAVVPGRCPRTPSPARWRPACRAATPNARTRDARDASAALADPRPRHVGGARHGPADSAAVLACRLTAELARYPRPRLPAEVSAAQQRIRRGLPLAFETSSALLGQWLLADFAGFPPTTSTDIPPAATRPNDLQAAPRRRPCERGDHRDRRRSRSRPPRGPGRGRDRHLDPLPEVAGAPVDTLPAPTAEQLASGRKLVS